MWPRRNRDLATRWVCEDLGRSANLWSFKDRSHETPLNLTFSIDVSLSMKLTPTGKRGEFSAANLIIELVIGKEPERQS
jgi:hypothetical protein